MAIYRSFPQIFSQTESSNCGIEGNTLMDFVDYGSKMFGDFNFLCENQSESFNKLSTVKVEEYFAYFKKLYSEYLSICLKDNVNDEVAMGSNNLLSRFKDDLIETVEKHFKISDKYYEKLKKIANQIFILEDEVSKYTKKIDDMEKDNYLFLSAKYQNRLNENFTDEKEKFVNENPIEYISINKAKGEKHYIYVFEQDRYYNEDIVGISYKLKSPEAVLVSSCYDNMTIVLKNGETPFKNDMHFHSGVFCVFRNKDYEVFSHGTKICTLLSAIENTSIDGIREGILDKSMIIPDKVFYMGEKPNERAYQLAKKYGIKNNFIKIQPEDDYNFVNLHDVYMDY